jgi:hypothetical protein
MALGKSFGFEMAAGRSFSKAQSDSFHAVPEALNLPH